MFGKGAVLMGMPIGIFSVSHSFSAWRFGGKFSGAAWWFLALLVILGLIVLLLPRWLVGVRRDEPRAVRKTSSPPSIEAPAKIVASPPPPVSPRLAERAAGVEAITTPAAPIIEPEPEPVAGSELEPEPKPVAPAQADDLTLVEGIGPKISALLQEAGILTFTQLSAANVDHLRQILDKPRFRLADPETWPEQAKLAAAGNWDGLAALQNTLKGGRRVN